MAESLWASPALVRRPDSPRPFTGRLCCGDSLRLSMQRGGLPHALPALLPYSDSPLPFAAGIPRAVHLLCGVLPARTPTFIAAPTVAARTVCVASAPLLGPRPLRRLDVAGTDKDGRLVVVIEPRQVLLDKPAAQPHEPEITHVQDLRFTSLPSPAPQSRNLCMQARSSAATRLSVCADPSRTFTLGLPDLCCCDPSPAFAAETRCGDFPPVSATGFLAPFRHGNSQSGFATLMRDRDSLYVIAAETLGGDSARPFDPLMQGIAPSPKWAASRGCDSHTPVNTCSFTTKSQATNTPRAPFAPQTGQRGNNLMPLDTTWGTPNAAVDPPTPVPCTRRHRDYPRPYLCPPLLGQCASDSPRRFLAAIRRAQSPQENLGHLHCEDPWHVIPAAIHRAGSLWGLPTLVPRACLPRAHPLRRFPAVRGGDSRRRSLRLFDAAILQLLKSLRREVCLGSASPWPMHAPHLPSLRMHPSAATRWLSPRLCRAVAAKLGTSRVRRRAYGCWRPSTSLRRDGLPPLFFAHFRWGDPMPSFVAGIYSRTSRRSSLRAFAT
ncbi:hypothetical protein DFH06DRAFT_1318105 [Mycena polygramma]|nr:hypothetical protein DFH06DRAFT_1318105 [Mycena polygramma]